MNQNHIILLISNDIMIFMMMLIIYLMVLYHDVLYSFTIINIIITLRYYNAFNNPYAYLTINLLSIYVLQYKLSLITELNVYGIYYIIKFK
jgi:hypothetical protein